MWISPEIKLKYFIVLRIVWKFKSCLIDKSSPHAVWIVFLQKLQIWVVSYVCLSFACGCKNLSSSSCITASLEYGSTTSILVHRMVFSGLYLVCAKHCAFSFKPMAQLFSSNHNIFFQKFADFLPWPVAEMVPFWPHSYRGHICEELMLSAQVLPYQPVNSVTPSVL